MNFKIELKWALAYSLLSLLWIYGEKALGFHDPDRYLVNQPYVTMLIILPYIGIFAWAMIEKRNKFYGGKMTGLQGFKTGIIMTGIITILAPLVQYIISTIITPDYFQDVINYVDKHKMMTREAAENQFNLKNYMIQSTIFGTGFGIVVSAILAFIVKRK